MPATVPGCVHTDRMSHGIIRDIDWRDKEIFWRSDSVSLLQGENRWISFRPLTENPRNFAVKTYTLKQEEAL